MEREWRNVPVIRDTSTTSGIQELTITRRPATELLSHAKRLVVLSSPLAFPGYITLAVRVSSDVVRALFEEAKKKGVAIECYHGHQATLDAISDIIGIHLTANRAQYAPSNEDVAVAIRLKKRLEKPEDIQNVKPDDIDFIVLKYIAVEAKS
jgi:hypothetical protein